MAAPTIRQVHFQTEGDGFKHGEGEATSAEKIDFFFQLANEDPMQETGPFSLSFLAGGQLVTGMTHPSMPAGSTDEEWLSAGPLAAGDHELQLVLESEDAGGYEWETPTVEESRWVRVIEAHRNAIPDDMEFGRDWAQVNIMITAVNFLGRPLLGQRFYVRVVDSDGQTAAHDGTVDEGVISVPQAYVPRQHGHLVLYVDTEHNGEHMRLESELVPFTVGGDAVVFRAVQDGRDIPVSASDERGAAREAGVEGSVGVEFGVFQAGGGASQTDTTSHTTTRTMEWTVRVPLESLKMSAV